VFTEDTNKTTRPIKLPSTNANRPTVPVSEACQKCWSYWSHGAVNAAAERRHGKLDGGSVVLFVSSVKHAHTVVPIEVMIGNRMSPL